MQRFTRFDACGNRIALVFLGHKSVHAYEENLHEASQDDYSANAARLLAHRDCGLHVDQVITYYYIHRTSFEALEPTPKGAQSCSCGADWFNDGSTQYRKRDKKICAFCHDEWGVPEAMSFVIYNHDGSAAKACGNGMRCLAYQAFQDYGLYRIALHDPYNMAYEAGLMTCEHAESTAQNLAAAVSCYALYKEPIAGSFDGVVYVDILELEYYSQHPSLKEAFGVAVCCGNPHLVVFGAQREGFEQWARDLETLPLYGKRTNVEGVWGVADGAFEMLVWERGAGITKSCGSGALATVAAALHIAHHQNHERLHLRAGISEDLTLRRNFYVHTAGGVLEIASHCSFTDAFDDAQTTSQSPFTQLYKQMGNVMFLGKGEWIDCPRAL